LLSDQWFVKMSEFAQSAIDAVNDGRVKFFPDRYARTYLDWLGEKRDWCVSRQLWWGHRIPIWYTRAPEAVLREKFADRPDVCWRLDEENAQWLVCGLEDIDADILGDKYPLVQDKDVLDTWFSSALWPHSTLGWPEKTPDLAYYYPTSTLVTSRDIITLWVARMVMTGLYNVGKIPFAHVYIHPKILDGFGETMSKTKGNGIDPLDIIDRYGTDALRFGMATTATETQDSRLPVANVCPQCQTLIPVKQEHMYMRTKKLTCASCKGVFRPGGPWPTPDPELPTAKQASEKFELGRNFANKLWNAARFLLMNLDGYKPEAIDVTKLPIEDRWIISRLATTAEEITALLEGYRFAEVAKTIYEFTWSEFCDWYVEMSKGRLRDEGTRALAQRVLAGVLDGILRLVHPIMPFVAESIWQALGESAFERGIPTPEPTTQSVCIAAWPVYPPEFRDAAMEARLGRMQDLVRMVREIRNRYMVEPKTQVEIGVRCAAGIAEDFTQLQAFIGSLASVDRMTFGEGVGKPRQSATGVHAEFEVYVSLAGLIDVGAEIARLQKQKMEKEKSLTGARGKLGNEGFVRSAKAEVVQQVREQVTELEGQLRVIEETLRDLVAG
jgi:valyl-tRNA synthetase